MNVNKLRIDIFNDAQAQFGLRIAAPALSGYEWCCLFTCAHDDGEIAAPIVKADANVKKVNLVDAIQRDGFSAFTLDEHLGDSLTVPNDLHFEFVPGLLG